MVKKIIRLIKLTANIAYRDTHLWECTNWSKTQDMKDEAKEIFESFMIVKALISL